VAISPETARRLAAARDISAVLVFCALVLLGGRAFINAPYLQKERLTQRQAFSDIEQFFNALENQRPGPREAALAEAAARADGFGRVTVRDLAYILYRHAAAAGGGTAVLWRPPRRWKDPEKRYPPFALEYRNGKFLVQAASNPALAGAELLKIDGRPAADFLAPALDRIAAAGPRHRAALFCRDQVFWWDLTGLLGGKPAFDAVFKLPGGAKKAARLEPATAGELRRLIPAPHAGREPFPVLRGTAWLELPPMEDSRAWRRRCTAAFRKLNAQRIGDLVVDLRANDGASARAARHLLSMLDSGLGKEAYKGRVKLLIGPGTANAAAFFAAHARELPAVEVIGEETGGPAAGFPLTREFTLGASAIRAALPDGRFDGPATARPEAVAPHLRLTEDLLRPHKGSVRTFLLSRIAAEREKAKEQ
jgi:hypothetical protein